MLHYLAVFILCHFSGTLLCQFSALPTCHHCHLTAYASAPFLTSAIPAILLWDSAAHYRRKENNLPLNIGWMDTSLILEAGRRFI